MVSLRKALYDSLKKKKSWVIIYIYNKRRILLSPLPLNIGAILIIYFFIKKTQGNRWEEKNKITYRC